MPLQVFYTFAIATPINSLMFQEFRGVEDGEDNARVKNRQVAKAAAQVLELESAGELCFALTTLRTETRGQNLSLNPCIHISQLQCL